MIDLVISFVIGIIVALGFGFAGIVRPEVIVGFLNFSGDWQPAVMLVMGSAVTVTFIAYRVILRRQRPLLEPKFAIPTRRDIDTRLVFGAILFGAGWGLTGYCPGPALASVFNGAVGVYVFLASMVAGMFLFKAWDRARQAAQQNRINSGTRQSGDNDQGKSSGPQKGMTPWNVQSSYQ